MKRIGKIILFYRLYWLLAAAACLLYAKHLFFVPDSATELSDARELLQQQLNHTEGELRNNTQAHDLAIGLTQHPATRKQLLEAAALPYTCLIYLDDSLIFWNDNATVPEEYPAVFPVGSSFQHFGNGYYLLDKENIENKITGKCLAVVRLVPVKFFYNSTNLYLDSKFAPPFHLPSYFIIDEQKESSGVPVVNEEGVALFKLFIDENAKAAQTNPEGTLFFFLGFFFLLLFLNRLILLAGKGRLLGLSYVSMLVILLVAHWLATATGWMPPGMRNLMLFDPSKYASGIAASLGHLLLSAVLILWASTLFQRLFHYESYAVGRTWLRRFMGTLLFVVAVFFFFHLLFVCKSLVRDSNVVFEFYNPFDPDTASLLAILTLSLLLIAYYLFADHVIRSLFRKPGLPEIFWYVVPGLGAAFLQMHRLQPEIPVGFMLGAPVLLFLVLWLLGRTDPKPFGFLRIFTVLVYFSVGASLLLNYYNREKEKNYRLTYARKLVNERDNVTEYVLHDLSTKVSDNKLVQDYFQFRHITQQDFEDRIYQQFFRNQFNRYDIKFYEFNEDGSVLRSRGKLRFDHILTPTPSDSVVEVEKNALYAILSSSGDLTYIAHFRVSRKEKPLGTLSVVLTARVYRAFNVYPELLLEEKNKIASNLNQYSYAVYHQDKLLFQSGDYPYSYHLYKNAEQTERYFDANGYNHLLLQVKPGTTIIISKADSALRDFTTDFSFVFVVSLLIIAALGLLLFLPRLGNLRRLRLHLGQSSFRGTVQAAFLVVIFLAVFCIGFISGRIFVSQFNHDAESKANEKMNDVLSSVKYIVNEENEKDSVRLKVNERIIDLLQKDINDISGIQGLDVNVFDTEGNLLVSSQPTVFDKGYLSRKINPFAYYELTTENKPIYIHDEKVGALHYLSGYISVRSNTGTPLAYINVPFFNSKRNLNLQLGYFFATLINILVVTLIIAAFLAPFISRQIIRKLSAIADRFKEVNLGKKNELIEWHGSDELGILVAEFNKMIRKLDESAMKLAQSERESAWREMAKQVAHEIKNPLTPMKLSIQHLQRAYAENSPRTQELADKVSKTLIEQIDNLSRIATEFSNFAKMPHGVKQRINLNQVLQNSVELYQKDEEAEIQLLPYREICLVDADPSQLLSVFNNLLLNAIQARAEDRDIRIVVSTRQEGDSVIVSIQDNGKGISPEDAGKVFRPNFTTKNSGTGLGLAISKNILDTFGASIYFESTPGVGTTFFVKFPLAPDLS